MSISKLVWVGGLSGVILTGAAIGTTWYAARNSDSPVARVMDGACHVAIRCQPSEGFKPFVDRLQAARSTAPNEVNLIAGGLPEDPTATDPAPIVIPEVEPQPGLGNDDPSRRALSRGFPADSATPVAPPAVGAPPMMPYCEDDDRVLPMPRVLPLESEEEIEADIRALFQDLIEQIRQNETTGLLKSLGTIVGERGVSTPR
ncbi:MAG: hypothetical protein EBV06_10295 [Planctomycetia bacterium]|nr:hypothetical protein [Planctomycetia bacterium]